MTALEHALALIDRVPVFPCGADKRPLVPHGFHAASRDPELIRFWWRRWPDALVGVPTGDKFVVVDIDNAKHADARGWLLGNRDRLPATRTHVTRSGGRHLFFKPHPEAKCSVGKLGPHVDVRGAGGYVIWWPAEGFEILHGDVLAGIPAWVLEALRPPPPAAITPQCSTVSPARAQRQLAGIVRVIAWANEGERNAKTFWGACRVAEMAREGFLKRDDGIAVVVEAAARAGLPRIEAASTARSAFRKVIGA